MTKSVLVYESGASLEKAQKLLDRFVKHGEMQRITIDVKGPSPDTVERITFYDCPTARIHLLDTDKVIIEKLRDAGGCLDRAELLKRSKLPTESFEKAVRRLEQKGIVVYDPVEGRYCLAGLIGIK